MAKDHMTTKDESKGSKTLLGMNQQTFDSKAPAGRDSDESVSKLGKATKGNPNS